MRGIPGYIRSDNGPEFVAEAVRRWIAAVGARTAFIEPGSPWENGYIESFNARPRDELFNGEIFYTLKEAQVLIESWRRHYNTVRPHGGLGFRPPAPETIVLPSWPPGGEIVNALTLKPDQSPGASQPLTPPQMEGIREGEILSEYGRHEHYRLPQNCPSVGSPNRRTRHLPIRDIERAVH